MSISLLQEDITLSCNDIKMIVSNNCIGDNKIVYFDFPLSIFFDIFFSIKSFTNADYIVNIELCFLNGNIYCEK